MSAAFPEIFGPQASRLIPPGDAGSSRRSDRAALDDPAALRNEPLTLRARVQAEFSADVMADAVLAAYARSADQVPVRRRLSNRLSLS